MSMFKKVFLIICLACSFPSVSWAQQVQVPFKAQFDFNKNSLYGEIPMAGNADPIYFEVQQNKDSGYIATINIKKWHSKFFDMSVFLDLVADPLIQQDVSSGQLKWSLTSHYTLLNNLPFEDMSANGTYGNGVLLIERAFLGGMILAGEFKTTAPYAVNMKIGMVNLNLKDFLPLFGFQNLDVEGTIGGNLYLSGEVPNIRVKGELHSFNGKIGQLEYYSMSLNIDGIYPEIYVIDSQIAQTDGFVFVIDGKLKLNEMDRFSEQIRSFVRKPLVQKNGDTVEWTLKKLQDSDEAGVTEFKYLKRRKEERMGGDSDMLGIERRMEF